MSSIVTRGYEVGNINLVVTMGYGQGAVAPPPPPPVVSAFPVGAGGWWDYEPPYERECRRKAKEHLQRVALGSLPADPEPIALPKQVETYIEKKVQQLLPRKRVSLSTEAQQRIVESVVREALKTFYKEEQTKRKEQEALRIQEENEEEEEVAFMFFLH